MGHWYCTIAAVLIGLEMILRGSEQYREYLSEYTVKGMTMISDAYEYIVHFIMNSFYVIKHKSQVYHAENKETNSAKEPVK